MLQISSSWEEEFEEEKEEVVHLFKFNFAPESHAVEFKDFKRKFNVTSSSNQSDIIC